MGTSGVPFHFEERVVGYTGNSLMAMV